MSTANTATYDTQFTTKKVAFTYLVDISSKDFI